MYKFKISARLVAITIQIKMRCSNFDNHTMFCQNYDLTNGLFVNNPLLQQFYTVMRTTAHQTIQWCHSGAPRGHYPCGLVRTDMGVHQMGEQVPNHYNMKALTS